MGRIGIIEYGGGNLLNVINALRRLGREYRIVGHGEDFAGTEGVIFPGVGAAGSAMDAIRSAGLAEPIRSCERPFLGICLGMQLLFDSSEEAETECLGIIPGRSVQFPPQGKVPHMGWNSVEFRRDSELFSGIDSGSFFYFVHSYYCAPSDVSPVIATTDYIVTFASAVEWRNFFGVQFHPEKSGHVGMELLRNFCRICS